MSPRSLLGRSHSVKCCILHHKRHRLAYILGMGNHNHPCRIRSRSCCNFPGTGRRLDRSSSSFSCIRCSHRRQTCTHMCCSSGDKCRQITRSSSCNSQDYHKSSPRCCILRRSGHLRARFHSKIGCTCGSNLGRICSRMCHTQSRKRHCLAEYRCSLAHNLAELG